VPDGVTLSDDPLLLYFTSGTSAKPKMVMHSHVSYPVGHLSTMYWLGLRPDDVHLNISSSGWAKHALSCFFAPWNAGATVVAMNDGRFGVRRMCEALQRHGVSSLCAPPTVWRLLIQSNMREWKVNLREAASAGEPLNPEVVAQVRKAWGITLRDGYGQTETTAIVGNSPQQPLRTASMGRPLPGYDVVLMNDDNLQAEEGEICISQSPVPAVGLMTGYADDAGAVRRIAGTLYRTGDIAQRDPDGWLTYVGRDDDVFESSDYRISPFELESVLIEHAAIAEAAVIPAPDPLRLSVPKALVILASGNEPSRTLAESIFQHLKARLAPYKRIRRLEFVSQLPKTISGKIRRADLRRAELERSCSINPALEWSEADFPKLN
jgi:acetyl-CoA synthetase